MRPVSCQPIRNPFATANAVVLSTKQQVVIHCQKKKKFYLPLIKKHKTLVAGVQGNGCSITFRSTTLPYTDNFPPPHLRPSFVLLDNSDQLLSTQL